MLKLLRYREQGVDSADRLQRAETTRRTLNLRLSNYTSVEDVHEGSINCIDLDPVECRHLLSCDGEGLIHIHDVHNSNGVPRCTYARVCSLQRTDPQKHSYSAETVQWYPHDTGLFTSSGMDKLLKVWDTNSMTIASEFKFHGQVYAHHQSPTATRHCLIAIACKQDRVPLVDLRTSSSIHSLRGHKVAVLAVQWSPRSEFLLATAGADSKILLWDVRSAKGSLRALDQHNGDTTAGPQSVNTAHNGHVNGLHFLPDGLHILSFGTDDTLRLWDADTGHNCLVNYGHVPNTSRKSLKLAVTSDTSPGVAFVPSGSDVEVLDVFGGEGVTTLRGHYDRVNSCAFNRDTHDLLSAGNDRNVLVWTPDTETVAAYTRSVRGVDVEHSTRTAGGFGETDGGGRSGMQKTVEALAADAWSSDED